MTSTEARSAGGLAVEANGPRGAPRIVLVHGSMDRMAGFAKVTRRLADTYRVVRYDRRGYGRSQPHPGPFTVADHIADLVEIVGDRDTVVVGHSLGGNIALGAAQALGERVRGVVIYESPLSWLPWWPGTSAGAAVVAAATDPADVAEHFMKRMIGTEVWNRLPPATREARKAEGPAVVGEIISLQAEAPWDAGQIVVPVACGRGSEGRPHHQRAMEVVAESIAGASVVTLEGCGHMAHVTHPDAFTDELIRPLVVRAGG